ncbi:hypothetical protein H8E52_00095 [bacterium]|nr:hypothetical protein [bacterium]
MRTIGKATLYFFPLFSLSLLACSDNDPLAVDCERDYLRLTLHRSNWTLAAEPVDFTAHQGIPTLAKTRAEASYWFHPQNATFRRDFNPFLDEEEAGIPVDVLSIRIPIHLTEDQLAAFPALAQTDLTNRAFGDSIWVGLMQGFRSSDDLQQSWIDVSQYEYLDIWINDFHQEPEERFGRLHIDLGMMSEDYWDPESNELDSEDRFNHGVFDELEEDTGLDRIYDPGEMLIDNPFADPSDPAGDNWNPEWQSETYPNSYFKINGTEGNRRLDTEDWNGNGWLDSGNSYFTFSVGLNASALVDMVEAYANLGEVPENNKAWRLYRFYLSEAEIRKDPSENPPDWSQIRAVRIWLEGMNLPGIPPLNALEIADLRFGDIQSPPW